MTFSPLTCGLCTVVLAPTFALLPLVPAGLSCPHSPASSWTKGRLCDLSPEMDHRPLFWLLLLVKKKIMASFVDVQRSSSPQIMCLFMENDFKYLLYKRLEPSDTPDFFEGWICVWICFEEGRCPGHAVGEKSDRESFPFGSICPPPGDQGGRSFQKWLEEGEPTLTLRPWGVVLECDHLGCNPSGQLLICGLGKVLDLTEPPFLYPQAGGYCAD